MTRHVFDSLYIVKKHAHTVIHRTRHFIRHLRTRRIISRWSALGVLFLLNVLFILSILTHSVSPPNTYIGSTNVGMLGKNALRAYIIKTYTHPLKVSINARNYDLTYEHMGVYLDPDMMIRDVFAPDTQPFPTNVVSFLTQITKPRQVSVPLSFTQEFYAYVDKLNDVGKNPATIVYVDQSNKQATLFTPEQRYQVDTVSLEQSLQNSFGRTDVSLAVPLRELPNDLETNVASANAKLTQAYATPLTVIVGLNRQNQFLTLSPSDLKRYTLATITPETGTIDVSINKAAFLPDLSQALAVYVKNFNPDTAYESIGNNIRDALIARTNGQPEDSVKVGLDNGPNTNGTIAVKYIEIDISQQKLFTFKDGKLLKMYRVSTGKDYPTPTGRFAILNKAGVGYSSIYHVWMPYWMAFSFSNELHAYFGIHELPYFYSGGNKIQRPRDFIGAPNTGGCVALDIGDAQEVYQFADVGTPVVIYQ